MFLGLPRAAQQNIWHLISVALDNPTNPENRQIVETYAQRFDANAAHVLGAVRACDFLLRQGASLGIDEASFRADLQALSGGNSAGVDIIMPGYVETRDRLRAKLLEDTLADHGNVVVGFDWRIDRVQVSSHGELSDVPVVFLNLRYRTGADQRQLSVQLPPGAIVELRAFLDRFTVER